VEPLARSRDMFLAPVPPMRPEQAAAAAEPSDELYLLLAPLVVLLQVKNIYAGLCHGFLK